MRPKMFAIAAVAAAMAVPGPGAAELNSCTGVRIAAFAIKSNFQALERDHRAAYKVLYETTETLKGLREMGIEIAIDDFGTGYSTFKLLKRLPVDILKIDQMFISNLLENKVDAAITRAIIDVAHALDMRVIAEGVEKVEHVTLLQALGCDSIQGFYLSEALPRAEITKLLKVGVPGKTKIRSVETEADELALA